VGRDHAQTGKQSPHELRTIATTLDAFAGRPVLPEWVKPEPVDYADKKPQKQQTDENSPEA
jgi:hypothetical protein